MNAATFAPHVGTTFALGSVELQLAEVTERAAQADAPRVHPFTVTFTSTFGGLLQGVQVLTHQVLGEVELFLVPRQPLADGLARYDADFN